MMIRDANMYKGTEYELIGGVLLTTNLVLIAMISRSLLPALYRNIAGLAGSVKRGSISTGGGTIVDIGTNLGSPSPPPGSPPPKPPSLPPERHPHI